MAVQLGSGSRNVAMALALLIASVLALSSTRARAEDPPPPANDSTTQNLEFMRAQHIPDKVSAIMQKVSNGQQLSSEDQKVLIDWSAQQGAGSAPPGSGTAPGTAHPKPLATGDISVGPGDTQSPCVPAGHAAGLDIKPSRSDYLAMAKATLTAFSANLSDDARDKLMQALKDAAPTAGSDLAPLLMVSGETDAAVVSAAYAAIQSPDDALSANNLGAMLKGAQDYAHAAVALQYAAGLAPKSPLIATNLGWLALSQGDSGAAGGFLKSAVQENPHMAGALAAQGLIQMCAGHAAQALPLFRASMAAGYSELAEQGVDIALDSAPQDSPGNTSDTGSPDIYGAKSKAAFPTWPMPPIGADAETMATYGEDNDHPRTALSRYRDLIHQAFVQAQNAYWAGYKAESDGGPRQTRFDGRTIQFKRNYEQEIFVLGDLRTLLQPELMKPLHDLYDQTGEKGLCSSCVGREVPADPCPPAQKFNDIYPSYAHKFDNDWVELTQALGDLYAFSTPWLARIHDPVIAAAEKGQLDSFALEHISLFAQYLDAVARQSDYAWSSFRTDGQTRCLGVPEAKPVKPTKLANFGVDPNDCQVQGTVLPLPYASMEANCDEIDLQIGVGPFAATGQYKFAPDYTVENGKYVYTGGDDGAWTIFAGGSVVSPGPVGVGAKAGGYVSFQGGHVTDVGLQAGTNLGTGPIPLAGAPSANARLGAMSGLSAAPSPGVAGGWSN